MKNISLKNSAPGLFSFITAQTLPRKIKRVILLVCFLACCGGVGAQGWFALGTGNFALNANAAILSICSDSSGNVYAAGQFTDSANANGKNYVAKWDAHAHQWTELGTGSNALNANFTIYAVRCDKEGNVYAAGAFSDTSTWFGASKYVAKWNGSTWAQLGSGANALNANGIISTMCIDDSDNIYVAGNFRNVYGNPYVAKWNGTTWNEVGTLAANNFINSICVDDSFNIYAGGMFTDHTNHKYIAKWQNSTGTWNELGSGFDSSTDDIEIRALCVDKFHNVYSAVNFEILSGTVYSNIFSFNGTSWEPLGTLHANNYTEAICADDSGYVYAAGGFTDTNRREYVSKYSQSSGIWTEVGMGSNALNSYSSLTTKPYIQCLWIDKLNNLYTGGWFTDSFSVTNNGCYVAEYGSLPTWLTVSGLQQGNISVFPNPAHDEIIIEMNLTEKYNSYALFDGAGRLYKSGIPEPAPRQTAIPISDIAAGMYFLKIGDRSFKVVKY